MSNPAYWPLAPGQGVGEGYTINSVQEYKWMVIVAGFIAFAMAWGIGANDVANAFATSVGAGSLTLRWAVVIAAVMEFAGALLMGSKVTDTVRRKILNTARFDPAHPNGVANGAEILMTGFLVALFSATLWIILATYLGLPVSTTHSIIGALVGIGLAFRGGTVIWLTDDWGLQKFRGVAGVFLSWIIAPIVAAFFAVILFVIVRHIVLRSKNPVRNGFIFLPFFYALAITVMLFFIIFEGSARFHPDTKYPWHVSLGYAIAAGVAFGVLSWWFLIPQAKRAIDKWEESEHQKLRFPERVVIMPDKFNRTMGKVGFNLELKEEISDEIIQMHDNVEKFDPKAERLFSWLQIFTAALDSFAHGANDVANSVGPFTSIYQLYITGGRVEDRRIGKHESQGVYIGGPLKNFKANQNIPDGNAYCGTGTDQKKTQYFRCYETPRFPFLSSSPAGAKKENFPIYSGKVTDTEFKFSRNRQCHSECNPSNYLQYEVKEHAVEIWILALEAVGIVIGLAMWGYRIIMSIGVKLTKLTPSRGFAIEIGAALTVVIAAAIGLPVSTTHCQVGATMGVGLVEFKGNTVNWKQFLFIVLGWIFTVVATGLLAAGVFSVLIHAPQEFSSEQKTLTHCPGQNLFLYDANQKVFRGINCAAH